MSPNFISDGVAMAGSMSQAFGSEGLAEFDCRRAPVVVDEATGFSWVSELDADLARRT